LSEILVMGKVFVVMLCYRPIQRLSDDHSINLTRRRRRRVWL